MTMACVCCCSTIGVQTRSFSWILCPRAKDLARGHVAKQTTLCADVCDVCFDSTTDSKGKSICLTGWDWWAAVDMLCSLVESYYDDDDYDEDEDEDEEED